MALFHDGADRLAPLPNSKAEPALFHSYFAHGQRKGEPILSELVEVGPISDSLLDRAGVSESQDQGRHFSQRVVG